jgi:hypothetical protein
VERTLPHIQEEKPKGGLWHMLSSVSTTPGSSTENQWEGDLDQKSYGGGTMWSEYGRSSSLRMKICFCLLFGFFFFLAALEFELRASHLLSRRSYCLSHSSSSFFVMGVSR